MKVMNGFAPSQEGNYAFVGSQSCSILPMSREGEYLSPEPAHSTQAAPLQFWVLWGSSDILSAAQYFGTKIDRYMLVQ